MCCYLCSLLAGSAPPPLNPDYMTSLLTTAYSASNYSAALQVLDESVNFVVTFSFKGVPALVLTFGSAALDVQSRPPSLPLLLTVSLPLSPRN